LYDYSKSDDSSGNAKDFYPNSKDEIFFIENIVGSIRCCFDFVSELQQLQYAPALIPKPIKEQKIKKKNDDDEDEPEPEPEEDDEDGKPKFNPDDYDWFSTDNPNKSLA
jgi:hypothetical protein